MAEFDENEKLILDALNQVREPSGKTILEAGLVVNVAGEDEKMTISCREIGLPPPIKQRLERDIRAAVQAKMPQIADVTVEWRQQAPAQPAPHQHAQPAGGQPAAPTPPNIKHIIAVGSGKGGVGKSTVAASLAYALKLRGHSVGLMDADVYGPSIPHMLGVDGKPEVVGQHLKVPEVDGIKVMSMAFMIARDQAVVWRGPLLHRTVQQFLYHVDWGDLDYLIVDLSPGTGDVVLSLSQQLPIAGGVIVCTPQDVALLDARKALSMLKTVKIPCLGVVENMSFFVCPHCNGRTDIFGCGGAEHWAAEAEAPFLGSVPINVSVRLNGDTGRLRDNFAADGPVRDALFAIADRVVAG
ncbi:MAG: Mrp/NBP35 family ATP-binding protein, partial [Planctomycetia bacterium]